MQKNIGIIDRIIRFVMIDLLLGASLAGMDINIPTAFDGWSFGLSCFLFLTILIGYSPFYHLLGISTKEKSEKLSHE